MEIVDCVFPLTVSLCLQGHAKVREHHNEVGGVDRKYHYHPDHHRWRINYPCMHEARQHFFATVFAPVESLCQVQQRAVVTTDETVPR